MMSKDDFATAHLVGIDGHVEDIMDLLDYDFGRAHYLGIHGPSGIGKTTLAKALCNKLISNFDQYCFLQDISASSCRDGLVYLQKKLLSNILGETKPMVDINDVDDGMKVIGENVHDKKVLIVLDDVDHRDQLEKLIGKITWFDTGSRFVITTKTKSILEYVEKIIPYELKEMNFDQALQLYMNHAFKRESPRDDYYDELSRDIVSTCGGLPLVVKVIGSFVHGKHKTIWKDTLEKLRSIAHEEVHQKLKLSYDTLNFNQKHIFLDIACFSFHEEEINTSYMWKDHDFCPQIDIEVLSSLSLIKIRENGGLWMHDLLKDLGRQIVCDENLDSEKRSRLWISEEAVDMVKTKENKGDIEALNLAGDPTLLILTDEDFSRLSNLRFLELDGGSFIGDFTNLFSKLRWFSWCHCPPDLVATNLFSQNLVVLQLSEFNDANNWEGWSQIKMLHNLKVLQLTRLNIIKIDLSGCFALERLIIKECQQLVDIDRSIGDLKQLAYLNIEGCHRLKDLSGEIGLLVKLKHLSLSNCSELWRLPSSIGNLNPLIKLDLSFTSIEGLPRSIGYLANLKSLSLAGCKKIWELPDSTGNLESLTELDLSSTCINVLPHSIGSIKTLTVIKIEHCRLAEFPSAIGFSMKLEVIHARGCSTMVGEVSSEIGKLSFLRILDLSYTRIRRVPETIAALPQLEELILENCDELQVLPSLPTSLTCLLVSSWSLQSISDLSNLTNLVNLLLSNRKEYLSPPSWGSTVTCCLEWIGKLSKLRNLELCLQNITVSLTALGSLSHLRKLYVSGLLHQIFYMEPPKSAILGDLRSVTTFPGLSNLRKLVILELCRSPEKDIELGGLEQLRHLTIRNCPALERITLFRPGLQNLKEMEICDCPMLSDIYGLRALALVTLENQFRPSISSLSDPPRLQKLMENRDQMMPMKTESDGSHSWKMKKIDSAGEAESTLMMDNSVEDPPAEDPSAEALKEPLLIRTPQSPKPFVDVELTLRTSNSESTLTTDNSLEDPLAEASKNPPLFQTPQLHKQFVEAKTTLTTDNLVEDPSVEALKKSPLFRTPQLHKPFVEVELTLRTGNSESTLTTDNSVKDPSVKDPSAEELKKPALFRTPQLPKRFMGAESTLTTDNSESSLTTDSWVEFLKKHLWLMESESTMTTDNSKSTLTTDNLVEDPPVKALLRTPQLNKWFMEAESTMTTDNSKSTLTTDNSVEDLSAEKLKKRPLLPTPQLHKRFVEAESTMTTDNSEPTLTTDNSVEDPSAEELKKPALFRIPRWHKQFEEVVSTLRTGNSESTLTTDNSVEASKKPPLFRTPQLHKPFVDVELTLRTGNSVKALKKPPLLRTPQLHKPFGDVELTLRTGNSVEALKKRPLFQTPQLHKRFEELKKPRLVWTPELDKRFVDAVAHLGINNAVPKTILQLMNVDGLTLENVASHLQEYRLYLQRMQGPSRGPDELPSRPLESWTNSSDTMIPDECHVIIQNCPKLGDTPVGGMFYKDYRDTILGLIKSNSDTHTSDSMGKVARMEEKRPVASVEKYGGTDDQVTHIISLMNIDDKDKQIVVVIQGEDGIGKTTLAKLIYNRVSHDFDGCSFLADFKETTRVSGGLQLLQIKLISDILKRELEDVAFVNRGIKYFKDLFCNMRVLIILDDVENAFHVQKLIRDCFDCFTSGSRILVTTRNSVVLEDSPQIRTYHVSQLDKDQARQLFRQHSSKPLPSFLFWIYELLTIPFAKARLPLFMDVMYAVCNDITLEECQNLLQRPTFQWRDFQIILERGLNYEQKQIFLDIACFSTGIDSRIALYLWHDFSLLPPSEILTPLAKIGENNQIWMHSTLRRLGREIVRGESLTNPGKRSRLFNHEIALNTIKRKKGTEKVEALSLNFQWHTSVKLTPEDFESMPNIRFLQLDHANITGDFANLLPNLRWLRWRGCPRHIQVTNFRLGNLTILDLSWSKVTKDWEGWDQIEMKNLRVLDLTGCADLLVTPKFSGCKNLAILILERCSQLVKIDHSIDDLRCLVSLNLKFCTELSMLPVRVGHLTALKELFMDGTSIQEIPISIGHLKQLETVTASNCFSLSHLPRTICHLTNISFLSLDGTRIAALPDSIGELVTLKHLSLRDCRRIRKLPNSICNIGRSLVELDMSGTGVSKFPDSILNLQNLKVLRMDSCFFREFPPAIGELTSLEEIHASWCRSLEGGIPSEIGKLHNLRILRLRHSTISSLPAEIHQLSNLRTLDLLHCDMIKKLPRLPSSIMVLCVDDELK